MLLLCTEEDEKSEGNVVIQVEDDAFSKTDNSVKMSVQIDRYIPGKSQKALSGNTNGGPPDTEATRKRKDSSESISEASDSGKGSKSHKGKKLENKSKIGENSEYIEIRGQEKTETERATSFETMKKCSVEEDQNEDTGNEIEEAILSERTDRTKAEEIVDEEVIESENEMKEIEELIAEIDKVTYERESREEIVEEIGEDMSNSEVKTVTERGEEQQEKSNHNSEDIGSEMKTDIYEPQKLDNNDKSKQKDSLDMDQEEEIKTDVDMSEQIHSDTSREQEAKGELCVGYFTSVLSRSVSFLLFFIFTLGILRNTDCMEKTCTQ